MSEREKKSTQWSEDRTLLANERTFSSWMSTGLACVGIAIGLHAVFRALEPTWAAKLVATIFLVTAIAIYWAAVRQACKTYDRLSETDIETQGPRVFRRLASMMTLGTVGAGVVLWMI